MKLLEISGADNYLNSPYWDPDELNLTDYNSYIPLHEWVDAVAVIAIILL